MNDEPLPIIAVGAGRVFQRLYLPALRRTPRLRLVAAADPSPAARAELPRGVIASDSIEGVLDVECAGMLVLSSPGLHAAHAALALDRGLSVLLEKPSGASMSELAAWPEEWRPRLTPARPRRYWPKYLAVRRGLSANSTVALMLETSPAAWGAGSHDAVVNDLLPHVIDLAAWLSRSQVESATGEIDTTSGRGSFALADGRNVLWEVAHGETHVERVTAGGAVADIARQSPGERIAERLRWRPPAAVLGVARMLRLWERRLRGEGPPGLPGYEDAVTEVRIRELLRS